MKFIFELIFVSFLVGSSLSILSGIVVELIYPKIVNDYWSIWWLGWIIAVAILFMIIKRREQQA